MENHPLTNEESEAFSDIASKLERVISDPSVEIVLNEVSNLEENYKSELIDSEDMRVKLGEINSLWPYRNKDIKVSGQIDVPIAEGRLRRFAAEDISAISRGFVSLKLSNEEADTETRLCHYLQIRFDNGELGEAFGAIDNVRLDCSYVSSEYAKNYLEYFDADLKTGIDMMLSGYRGPNSARVLALKDLEVQIDSSVHDPREMMSSVEEYVNSQIDLDPEGYIIGFKDPFLSRVNVNSDESIKVNKPGFHMAKVHSLQFMPSADEKIAEHINLKPNLKVDLHPEDPNEDIESYYVPLESIDSLMSHRDVIYGDESNS